ncbi:MAG: cupin domain-containing protein [Chitinophagales bacterium]
MSEKSLLNQSVFFRALGTTYKVVSESVNGSAAIVEHTLEPKSIGAPMHKHTHEDEISYVIEGNLSVIQNDMVQVASAGQFIVKPRGIFHTFWNAGDERLRFLEFIVPGNFSNYFAELAPFLIHRQPPQMDKVAMVANKYGLIIDPSQTPTIIKKYGLNQLG